MKNHFQNNLFVLFFKMAFLLVLFDIATAAEVNFSSFGGKTSDNYDNSAAFEKAFAFAEKNPNTTILLDRGIYRVGNIAYKGNGINSILHIKNTNNLTIKGANTEILFTNSAGGIFAEQNKHLTIDGIAFDYDPVPFNQGVVRKILGNESILVSVDSGFIGHESQYFYDEKKARHSSWLMFFDENNNLITSAAPKVIESKRLSNSYLLYLDKTGVQLIKKSMIKPGHRYVRTIRDWGHLFRFHFSDDTVLNNITIHSASEFAGLFAYSSNVTIYNSKISKKPFTNRLISTSADGWHFTGARIGPRITNSIFENQADDSIVISVRGSMIEAIEDCKTLILRPANPIFYEKGDIIEVIDIKNNKKYKSTVAGAIPKGAFPSLSYKLSLTQCIPSEVFGNNDWQSNLLVFNRSQACNGAVVKGNLFKYIRARAILAHGTNITISNNTFSYIGGAAIAGGILAKLPMAEYSDGYWAYAPSENIEISGNRIDHALNWGKGWGYKASISFDSTWANEKDGSINASFDSISVINNVISGLPSNKKGIYISQGANSKITNNIVMQ